MGEATRAHGERCGGAMMIALSVYFLFFLLFGLVILDAAKTTGSISVFDEALSVSAVSTLAEYDTYLLKRWGLLAIEQPASHPSSYGADRYEDTTDKLNDIFGNSFGNMFKQSYSDANSSLVPGVTCTTPTVSGVGDTTLGNTKVLKASIQEYAKQALPLMLGKDFDNFYKESASSSAINEVSTDSVVGAAAKGLQQETVTESDTLLTMIDTATEALDDAIRVVGKVDGAGGLRERSRKVENLYKQYKDAIDEDLTNHHLKYYVSEFNRQVDLYNKKAQNWYNWIGTTNSELDKAKRIKDNAIKFRNEFYGYANDVNGLNTKASKLASYIGYSYDSSSATYSDASDVLSEYNNQLMAGSITPSTDAVDLQNYINDAADAVRFSTDPLQTQQYLWNDKGSKWQEAFDFHNGSAADPSTARFKYSEPWPTNATSYISVASSNYVRVLSGDEASLHRYNYLDSLSTSYSGSVGFTLYMQPNQDAVDQAVSNVKKMAGKASGYINDLNTAIQEYLAAYDDAQSTVSTTGTLWGKYYDELYPGTRKYVQNRLVGSVTLGAAVALNPSSTPGQEHTKEAAPLSVGSQSIPHPFTTSHQEDGFWNDTVPSDRFTLSPSASDLAKLQVSYLTSYAQAMQKLMYFLQKLLYAYPINDPQVANAKTTYDDINNGTLAIKGIHTYYQAYDINASSSFHYLGSSGSSSYVKQYNFMGDKLGSGTSYTAYQLDVTQVKPNIYKLCWVIPEGKLSSSGSPDHGNEYDSKLTCVSYLENMRDMLLCPAADNCLGNSSSGGFAGEAYAQLTATGAGPYAKFNVGDPHLSAIIDTTFYQNNISLLEDEDGNSVKMTFNETTTTGTDNMVKTLRDGKSPDDVLNTISAKIRNTYDVSFGIINLSDIFAHIRDAYKDASSGKHQAFGALVEAMAALGDEYKNGIAPASDINSIGADEMSKYWLGERLMIAGYGAYSTSNRFNYNYDPISTSRLQGKTLTGMDLSNALVVDIDDNNDMSRSADPVYGNITTWRNALKITDPGGHDVPCDKNPADDPSYPPNNYEYTFAGAELEYLVKGSHDEWRNQYYTYMLLLQMGMLRSADAVAFNDSMQDHASKLTFAYPLVMITNIFELGIHDTNLLCAAGKAPLCRTDCPPVGNNGIMYQDAHPTEPFSLFPQPGDNVNVDASYDRKVDDGLLYRDHCLVALLAFVPRTTIVGRVRDLVQMETLNCYKDNSDDTGWFQLGQAYTFIKAESTMQVRLITPIGWDLTQGLADSNWLTYDRVVYRGY